MASDLDVWLQMPRLVSDTEALVNLVPGTHRAVGCLLWTLCSEGNLALRMGAASCPRRGSVAGGSAHPTRLLTVEREILEIRRVTVSLALW